MNRTKKIIMTAAHFLVLGTFFLLLVSTKGFVNAGPTAHSAEHITRMTVSVDGGPEQEITLPHIFRNLPPRTPVVLKAEIFPRPDDVVYVKSMYSPAKVYLDNALMYEFGREECYPGYMIDPAMEVHLVETNGVCRSMDLRIEFLSPSTQKRLSIQPPILGSSKEVILERFHSHGFPFVLSLAQIIYGISLLFISLCTYLVDKKGISFLWLGLLSLSTGLWSFGESNFTAVIFKNSTLLYILSFSGFFTFIIPLLRFSRSIIEFENPRPLWYTELVMLILAAAALISQFLGILACSTSMYLFYLVLPLVLAFLTVLTVKESIRCRNVAAKRFILPISVLTVTAFMGLGSYIFSVDYTVSTLIQLGIVFFLLVVGVTAGLSMKDSIDLKNKEKELNFEKDLMEIRIKEQENYGKLLNQHEQLLSQQRHDLRHHLNVVKALAAEENTELQEYLQSLMDNIPAKGESCCENRAVNAILVHYQHLCRQKGIELIMNLVIPENNPHMKDSALCVIFGNLLENAVEACDRMTQGRKFIQLRSKQQYEMLVITMDNSFNGELKQEQGRFRSSKRDEFGIGLSSVRSVAEQSGGSAEFEGSGTVFLSSVFVKL